MKLCRLTASAVFLAATGVPSVAWAIASAELYSTTPYFYGRFEARLRYAAGDGVVSAFFLWKEGSEVSGTFWNELDYEKVGANCELHTNAYYGNPAAVHTKTHTISGLCSDYHDYRYEWTPTYIAWVVDGQEIRRETGDVANAYAQNATDGMTFHFNIWPGDQSFGGNLDPSILPVYQYISWVQYSSYKDGAFTLEWREDFNATDLPSGWALGDWGSPKGKSTHNPDNVGFVNGIAVLAVTDDGATGVPSTVPADGASTGGTGSGGTSGGGTTSGGAATGGGTATGGTAAGGTSSGDTGGRASGGTSSGGGATAGGSAAGGATSGGANTGGTSTGDPGGRAAGGTNTGGANVGGGTSVGGRSTGGAGTSGATGGSSSGGAGTGTGSGGQTTAITATGGSSASGGNATGGATSASTGVATGGTSAQDSGAAGAARPATDASENSGCGCRVPAERHRSGWPSALGLLALVLFVRRRTPVRGTAACARARVP